MTIYRVRAIWSGFQGAPGYTNMFFSNDSIDPAGASQTGATVKAMFTAISPVLPVDVDVQVQGTVDVFALGSGQITGQVTMSTVPTKVTGAGTGAYSAPSGASISWNTDTYANGRRRKGRTYFVPLVGSAYESDGSLSSTVLGYLQNAGNAILNATGTTPVVWHRAVGGTGAEASVITAFSVRDAAAVLRSRRD